MINIVLASIFKIKIELFNDKDIHKLGEHNKSSKWNAYNYVKYQNNVFYFLLIKI